MYCLSSNKKLVIPALVLVPVILAAKVSPAENVVSGDGRDEIVIVEVASLDELMRLFDRLNYNKQSWQQGNLEIPRIIFEKVHEEWKNTSPHMPVEQKKGIFFRLMAPLVLMANEDIQTTRRKIIHSKLDSPLLRKLATSYRIKIAPGDGFTEQYRQRLLDRVDILPPSLVLAQAAEESGWGTSRFVIEGNSFFGQWDFSGNGMVPAEQRKELGNYGIARFDSPLESVEGYMLNINSHPAYKKLRELRSRLRAENKPITGLVLAGTLGRYSERGQEYVDDLREMISYNRLDLVDYAYLSDTEIIRLVRVANN